MRLGAALYQIQDAKSLMQVVASLEVRKKKTNKKNDPANNMECQKCMVYSAIHIGFYWH